MWKYLVKLLSISYKTHDICFTSTLLSFAGGLNIAYKVRRIRNGGINLNKMVLLLQEKHNQIKEKRFSLILETYKLPS